MSLSEEILRCGNTCKTEKACLLDLYDALQLLTNFGIYWLNNSSEYRGANMLAIFEEIGKKFRLKGRAYSFAIRNGNINSADKVTYREPDGSIKADVFRKINTFVFTKPVEIMENIGRVTAHIRAKNASRVTLPFHRTAAAKNFVFDQDGNFRRVMNCIDSIDLTRRKD